MMSRCVFCEESIEIGEELILDNDPGVKIVCMTCGHERQAPNEEHGVFVGHEMIDGKSYGAFKRDVPLECAQCKSMRPVAYLVCDDEDA